MARGLTQTNADEVGGLVCCGWLLRIGTRTNVDCVGRVGD